MQLLTELALQHAHGGVFTRPEVSVWVGGSDDRQAGVVKRAIAAGEVIRIHRGLYCLAPPWQSRKPDPLAIAQRIHGPSYISVESALSFHGAIPEAVYTITSASCDRSIEADTPLGRFAFTRVPQRTFYAEVLRVTTTSGEPCLMASPVKALSDYVYTHRCHVKSLATFAASLRMDESFLRALDPAAASGLIDIYTSRRVRHFLHLMIRELHQWH